VRHDLPARVWTLRVEPAHGLCDVPLADLLAIDQERTNASLVTHVQGVRLNHTIFPREERPARVCGCMAL